MELLVIRNIVGKSFGVKIWNQRLDGSLFGRPKGANNFLVSEGSVS